MQKRTRGRSARVQTAVIEAVEALAKETDRGDITVPMVAAKAGVTPSTIYRRWGGLNELFADAAVKRLRPVDKPLNTGSTEGDLLAWIEQFAEEMSSEVGRSILRDVLSDPSEKNAGTCNEFITEQLRSISNRASGRGEQTIEIDHLVEMIVAPIIYRILFGTGDPDAAYCRLLVRRVAESRNS